MQGRGLSVRCREWAVPNGGVAGVAVEGEERERVQGVGCRVYSVGCRAQGVGWKEYLTGG